MWTVSLFVKITRKVKLKGLVAYMEADPLERIKPVGRS
jgi:hypothetical protein